MEMLEALRTWREKDDQGTIHMNVLVQRPSHAPLSLVPLGAPHVPVPPDVRVPVLSEVHIW